VHKPSTVVRLEQRLAELGCPARERERRAREIAEHYEDLKLAGLEEGLSEAAAEARANELLGEPVSLAQQLAAVFRQSSWWGRHRLIGFCLLPPLGIFVASVLSLFAVLGCLRVCFSASEWRVLADQGPGFRLLVLAVDLANYAATAGTSILFCWLAQRSMSGVRWAMLACGVCSVQSCFGYCRIAPHAVSIGYSASLDWLCVLIPLLVAGASWARQTRTSKMPGGFPDERPNFPPPRLTGSLLTPNRDREIWRQVIGSPTYWIAALVALTVSFLALFFWMGVERGRAQIKTKGETQSRLQAVQHAVAAQDVRTGGLEQAQSKSGSASPANKGGNQEPWRRIVMIGASATAGFTESELFGGPQTAQYKLSRYVEAALIGPHEPVRSLASTLLFLQPETEAQREIDLAKEAKPSMVIGVDFLFWFCYGEGRTDQERLARFEKGLKLLEAIPCPLVIGDIPDASGALNRMLGPEEMPSTAAMAAANRRLKEWASARRNVAIVPLSSFMRTVIANGALSIHGRTLPAGKTGIFLQNDRLHPSAPGCAVLALMALDSFQSRHPEVAASEIRWDPQEVFRRGYNSSQPPNQRSSAQQGAGSGSEIGRQIIR
jgi:hypothetical protein